MIDVPKISYGEILALVMCVGFFVSGARMEGKSALVWGGLSLGAWLAFTHVCIAGLAGGLISQVLLFVGLALHGIWRESSHASSRSLGVGKDDPTRAQRDPGRRSDTR